ncbi:MAG TPA: hypothetical protein VME41_00945 [Stellaceae bacterium]|nr:hypothetical protein [Stellaceae bacterium]
MSASPLGRPLDRLGAPLQRLKRSRASLVGGIACGGGTGVLVLLLLGGPSLLHIAVALAIGAALGTWVRLADL